MTRAIADTDAIERLVASQQTPRHRIKIVVAGVLFPATAIFVPVIGAPFAGEGDWWQETVMWWRAEPWSALGLPILFGIVMAIFLFVTTSGPGARDVSRIARRIERDWRYLTDKFWILRVALGGIVVGCLIGIPIGTLLALDARPSELEEVVGGRVGVAVMFLLMTWLWTLPSAFLFRFLMLRSYRRFVRIVP